MPLKELHLRNCQMLPYQQQKDFTNKTERKLKDLISAEAYQLPTNPVKPTKQQTTKTYITYYKELNT